MKRSLSILFVLIVILAACAPKSTEPPPTEPPATEPPATEPPATEPPTEPPLEPVELAGPPMEVGSTYVYVDGSILVAVPGGEFIMGDGGKDSPEHTVSVDDFWVYRYPVTNRQYEYCVEMGRCAVPDLSVNLTYGDLRRSNDPVTGVTHYNAVEYCDFVHGRPPTEAEYEYAMRGPDSNIYPWGNNAPTCALTNAGNCEYETTDVTLYNTQGWSKFLLAEGVGNVKEWMADWYSPNYYSESPPENPFGPETGNQRSVRSSAFDSPFYETPLARRDRANPTDTRNNLGFRCVVFDPLYFAPYCENVMVYGFDFKVGGPLPKSPDKPMCKPPDISEGLYCGDNYTPYTIVTVNYPANPSDWLSVDPGVSCSQSDPSLGPNQFLCTDYDTVEVCVECPIPLVDGACPPGFAPQGDKCVLELGRPGECLPGATYDPELECCQLSEKSWQNFFQCQPGEYFVYPPGACVNDPDAIPQCKKFHNGLDDCGPGDGYSSLPESSPLVHALVEEQPQTPVAPVSGVLTLTTLVLVGWVFYGRKRS